MFFFLIYIFSFHVITSFYFCFFIKLFILHFTPPFYLILRLPLHSHFVKRKKFFNFLDYILTRPMVQRLNHRESFFNFSKQILSMSFGNPFAVRKRISDYFQKFSDKKTSKNQFYSFNCPSTN